MPGIPRDVDHIRASPGQARCLRPGYCALVPAGGAGSGSPSPLGGSGACGASPLGAGWAGVAVVWDLARAAVVWALAPAPAGWALARATMAATSGAARAAPSPIATGV